MKWKTIRLELAGTHEFPTGSPTRAYLLRLPVTDDGAIDEEALRALPARATVRRFWPNQPDMAGHVIPTAQGWAFSYRRSDEEDDSPCPLDAHLLKAGEHIMLTEPDGRRLPFRVASVQEMGQFAAARN